MSRKNFNRFMAALLAFVIFFEPFALSVLRAGELPKPVLNTDDVTGIVSIDEIVAPLDYLEYIMRLRGKTKADAEARAWGEWMTMLQSSFIQMDDGASDVFNFYEAMKMLRENSTVLADISDVTRGVVKFTTLGFSFAFRSRLLSQSTNLVLGFMRLTNMAQSAQNWVDTNRVFDFMEFTAPPPCWNNPEVAGQGFKSYWRWVQNKAGNTSVTSELTDGKGIARSIGVGLVIVGLAIDAWGIVRSEDRQGDRTSYSLAKHYVGAALGVASLVAMFCTPFIGQIVLIAGLVWAIVAITGDLIGAYNKRWKDAYKNSFWYLYENDDEFRSFYDNRQKMKNEEKTVSLQLVEKRYSEFKVAKPLEGDTVEAKNSRVYIALEKQGVLVSYYGIKGFSLPDFNIEKLKQLWQMKADYMSWKPTEAEAAKNKTSGFWGKLGKVVNPMTYAAWIGDKSQSEDYLENVKQYNLQKVFFNPDYVLIKKYLNYTTGNKLKGGVYDAVGLRIEQSPFNYAPLIGIDTSAWNEALMNEAFVADSFQIGQKEIVYLREQVKTSAEKAEGFVKDMDEAIAKIDRKDLPQSAKIRKFLDALGAAYKSNPDKADAQLFNQGRLIFDWPRTAEAEKKTPAAIIRDYEEDLEKTLLYEPLSISHKAAETVILMTTIKQQLDMAALMHDFIKDKTQKLHEFDTTFKTREIKTFLKEGTFLDVEGGTVCDWFSQIYSTYDEADKHLKLLAKDVTAFTGVAENANTDTRERTMWFDRSVTHPTELLEKLNKELKAWEKTINAWAKLGEKIETQIVLAEDPEFARKVFVEFKLGYELTPLNPETPVAEEGTP